MVVMVLGAGFWVNFDGAWRVSGGGSQWFVCFFRDKASGLWCYIFCWKCVWVISMEVLMEENSSPHLILHKIPCQPLMTQLFCLVELSFWYIGMGWPPKQNDTK